MPGRSSPSTPASDAAPSPVAGDPRLRDATVWVSQGVPETLDPVAAEAWCRRVAAGHYENFTVASRLVPPRLRQDLANVYAYARWSDDLVDEATSALAALEALSDWRRRLESCFAGRPDHPLFVALSGTVRRTGLEITPFLDLLDAFEEDRAHDARGVTVRYSTRDDLVAYCRRSADPVGRIVLGLEGCREPALVSMSDQICTGLQLVNFWQDVRRDRIAGRVYLPADDMARHGVDESDLDGAQGTAAYRGLIRDEVAWARALFDSGAALERAAPPSLRVAIGMFLAGGRAVADAIAAVGHDTLVVRPTLSRWRKAGLAGRTALSVARATLTGWR